MKGSRAHDIAIRLPAEKKYIKRDLVKAARRAGLSVNRLVILALESFLAADEITFKVK